MGNACARPVIIPAPDGPVAKPVIDEKELANRAARLAAELFGPLEDSVVAQLDELVNPEYLKQISVPGAVTSQLTSESIDRPVDLSSAPCPPCRTSPPRPVPACEPTVKQRP